MEINYPTGKIQLLIHLNISIESTVARIEINWRLLIKMSPLEIQERMLYGMLRLLAKSARSFQDEMIYPICNPH